MSLSRFVSLVVDEIVLLIDELPAAVIDIEAGDGVLLAFLRVEHGVSGAKAIGGRHFICIEHAIEA